MGERAPSVGEGQGDGGQAGEAVSPAVSRLGPWQHSSDCVDSTSSVCTQFPSPSREEAVLSSPVSPASSSSQALSGALNQMTL